MNCVSDGVSILAAVVVADGMDADLRLPGNVSLPAEQENEGARKIAFLRHEGRKSLLMCQGRYSSALVKRAAGRIEVQSGNSVIAKMRSKLHVVTGLDILREASARRRRCSL